MVAKQHGKEEYLVSGTTQNNCDKRNAKGFRGKRKTKKKTHHIIDITKSSNLRFLSMQ